LERIQEFFINALVQPLGHQHRDLEIVLFEHHHMAVALYLFDFISNPALISSQTQPAVATTN
jgi:hypothetical protein